MGGIPEPAAGCSELVSAILSCLGELQNVG